MGLEKFIDNIPNDKKGHLILGTLINPVIVLIGVITGIYFFSEAILGGVIGSALAISFHGFIEFYQKYFQKNRNPEWLDFYAGSYSAIWYLIILILLNYV